MGSDCCPARKSVAKAYSPYISFITLISRSQCMFDKLKFWKKEESSFDNPQFQDAPPLSQPQAGFNPPNLGGPGASLEPDFREPAEPQSRGVPPLGQPQFGDRSQSFSQPSFSQPSFNQPPQSQDQQFQLISAKLDTIKAQLETVLNRLDNLERKNPPLIQEERPYQQRWRTSS